MHACIIIVQVPTESTWLPMGTVVDGVSEVLTITAADREQMPDFGTAPLQTCLQGVAEIKGQIKLLLDIHRLLSGKEIIALANARA